MTMQNEKTILKVENLIKYFPLKKTIFDILAKKPTRYVKAVDKVSTTPVKAWESIKLVSSWSKIAQYFSFRLFYSQISPIAQF